MQAQSSPASEIAAVLASQAEAVCRHYLPAGQRQGRYWIAGDVHGARGQSLFVRLHGPRSGKWTDGATGDHGDLLDLIKHRTRSENLRETLAEARSFLAMPAPSTRSTPSPSNEDPSAAIERLWRACRPIAGTHAEEYLQARGIRNCRFPSLRYHPKLHYRDDNFTGAFPALVAAATDARGQLTGLHRTWLDPKLPAKAPVELPRKALGRLFGSAVRFPPRSQRCTLVVGEGIETVLSIITAYPGAAGAAALSTAGVGSFSPPASRRIAIARENDLHGIEAANRLAERCENSGIVCRTLIPRGNDFNDDLVGYGARSVRCHLGSPWSR